MQEAPPSPLLATYLSFGLYFGTLLFALATCLARAMSFPVTLKSGVYLLIASASANITWLEIIRWMESLLADYQAKTGGSFTDWMQRVDIFDAAYALVVNTTEKWWWSSQHLLFTVSVMIFFWREGIHRALSYPFIPVSKEAAEIALPRSKRSSKKAEPAPAVTGERLSIWFANTFVFVLLGFLGAISTCLALFLIQHNPSLKSHTLRIKDVQPTAALNTFILMSVTSIAATIILEPGTFAFFWNLRALHLFLILPIILDSGTSWFKVLRSPLSPPSVDDETTKTPVKQNRLSKSKKPGKPRRKWEVKDLYNLVGFMSLVSHLTLTAFYFARYGGTVTELIRAVFDNHCQTSITADYLFAMVAVVVFMITETRRLSINGGLVFWMMLSMPLLSSSSIFPFYLALRETAMLQQISEEADEKRK
ncbi:hypothetical protein SmJEL517_g01617 [Synchytrium microbalum]|uniref:Uncharacterized protein n=1 Tax=Synchytrium microbalum TaxID=1806994 RepID=A0A507CDL4_9FUNG|nr:uncharacterized protein SmJEL517_g01617 [Synchytrium microbalum]TPX36136.1 hypothetical protein SmJEL517_g01617 [Synchytrium microbalum]